MTRPLQIAVVAAIALAAALVVLVNAIGDNDPPATGDPTPTPTVVTDPSATAVDPTSTATPGPTAAPSPTPTPTAPDVSGKAMALLVSGKGISPGELSLVSYEPVDWPSAALGCPEPGVFYDDVIVPGWLVLIGHGDETYEFHADESEETIINCTDRQASMGQTVNAFEEADLDGTTRVDISRRNSTSGEYEPVEVIEDEDEVRRFVEVFDIEIALSEQADCTPVFKLTYRAPGGAAQEFGYICDGNSRLVRGDQDFWEGSDGTAARELGDLVGPYVSNLPMPGFPEAP
ncbi:MAG: hypothetical protein WD333_11320 [Dehalococcoidia bacterium]